MAATRGTRCGAPRNPVLSAVMMLRARGLVWLSLWMAVACIGVGDDGGHCLNPQPDLPCNHATGSTPGAGGASSAASGGSGQPPLDGSGAAGNSSIVTPGSPSAEGGASSDAAGGDGPALGGESGADAVEVVR